MVSVIIPVRNGSQLLPDQLEALAAQRYTGDWEVVVVDNGSEDDTRERASAMAPRFPRLRVIDASEHVGVGHARNAGAAAAEGELLMFCDSDDRVHPDWLEAMIAALGDADAAGGALDWTSLNSPAVRIPKDAGTNALMELATPFLPYPSGSNCAVRAAVFHALGGFDESFRGGGDDVEFFWRLQLAGHRLVFAPDARVASRERATLLEAARQTYDWARREPHLFREFRSAGMRRSSVRGAVRGWAHLLLSGPRSWPDRSRRRRWIEALARRFGRLAGSVRFRVLYL